MSADSGSGNERALASWSRVNAVFDAVLRARVDEQADLVERLCGQDPDLRHQVLALVEADRADSGILDQRAELFAAPYVGVHVGPEDGQD